MFKSLKHVLFKVDKTICYIVILPLMFMAYGTHVVTKALISETLASWQNVDTKPRSNNALTNPTFEVSTRGALTEKPQTEHPHGVMKKRVADTIVFGVSKCGTAAVVEFLKFHPKVVAPNHEIHYFNLPKVQEEHGFAWYLDQMPLSYPDQVTLVKSPDYFSCAEAPKLIHNVKKDTKLILLLRDPVRRLVSEYMQFLDKHSGDMPAFEDWTIDRETRQVRTNVPSVKVGMYSENLVHWYKYFNTTQIHIIDTISITEHPFTEMKKLEMFLNIEPFYEESDFSFNSTKGFHCIRNRNTGREHCLGKTKGREHVEVHSDLLNILYDFYEPYNQKLFKMLNRTFPWPRNVESFQT